MNEEINLCTYISIYTEFNSLIKNYFTRKINAKENLDDVMIKIYPKFKTPIKYRNILLNSRNNNINNIKYYKRPINKIINKSCDNKYKRNIYCKSPINDRNRYIKKRKINNAKSYDNIIFKKKIGLYKKKKISKIKRDISYDYNKPVNHIKKESINQKRIEYFNQRFKQYRLFKQSKNPLMNKKELMTKNIKNINSSFSTNDNTFFRIKKNDLSNEFILYIIQKINKNINQFVFYKIKGEKNINDINIFFSIIKKIINIYNTLLKDDIKKKEYVDILKYINTNLSQNIENYNKNNYISFIPKNNENNLINTQLFPNNKDMLNFIIDIIKIEKNFTMKNNTKYNIQKIFKNNKLKNRNIFTIIRYTDILYKKLNDIYYTITKVNKFNYNNAVSSGEIDVFKNIKENKKQKIIINKIYDEYCFDKINKMRNIFYNSENNSECSKKEKIRQISNLSKETESDIINEINYNEEDIIFNQIKECFNKLYK